MIMIIVIICLARWMGKVRLEFERTPFELNQINAGLIDVQHGGASACVSVLGHQQLVADVAENVMRFIELVSIVVGVGVIVGVCCLADVVIYLMMIIVVVGA